MVVIKNSAEQAKMREAGKRLATIFHELEREIAVGMTTLDVDRVIVEKLKKYDLVSQTKGYCGYKHSSCVSINNEVVHGVPKATKVITDGDVVTVDICAAWNNYCADAARTFLIGTCSEVAVRLVRVAEESLVVGINAIQPGRHLSDLSNAIQKTVEAAGFGVVRDFAGHGIGRSMHEDPEVLNYGPPGRGLIMRPGMTFAVEPMITAGRYDVRIEKDGWTVTTVDGSLAAHVEHTVLVTESGAEILTKI